MIRTSADFCMQVLITGDVEAKAFPLLTDISCPVPAVGLRAMSFRSATPASANAGTLSHQPKMLFTPSSVSSLVHLYPRDDLFSATVLQVYDRARVSAETAPMFVSWIQIWVRPIIASDTSIPKASHSPQSVRKR